MRRAAEMGELPPEVADFVHRYVRSSDELELLLLLRRSGKPWTAVELGATVARPASSVADDLESLFRRGLVAGSGGRYRYEPDRRDLEPVMDELVETYRRGRRLVDESSARADIHKS
jgi:DNA-binding IclR family transcriptional regulator